MQPSLPTLAGIAGLGPVTHTVLRRMEADYARGEELQPGTVAAMYGTYAAHTAAFAWAATHRSWPLPLPRRPAIFAGALTATGGAAVMAAGMVRFDSTAQLSGTDTGTLHDRGIYRYSRNPQYLGAVVALAGITTATRSGLAALLTAGVLATYRRWIPNEEKVLHRTFGDDYDRYSATVHRWFGRTTHGTKEPTDG